MLIMHIGHISRAQSFQQNRHIIFHALVALMLLVSLISRLVACSARIVVDRQTDRHTDQLYTVTLAAHARRGLIKLYTCIVVYIATLLYIYSHILFPIYRKLSCTHAFVESDIGSGHHVFSLLTTPSHNSCHLTYSLIYNIRLL